MIKLLAAIVTLALCAPASAQGYIGAPPAVWCWDQAHGWFLGVNDGTSLQCHVPFPALPTDKMPATDGGMPLNGTTITNHFSIFVCPPKYERVMDALNRLKCAPEGSLIEGKFD